MKAKYLIVLLVAAGLAGCIELGSADSEAKIQAMEAKIAKLEMQLLDLRVDVYGLNRTAFITVGTEGYAIVNSDFGPVPVAVKGIKEVGNGSQVTLEFGNLTTGRIGDLKASIAWGQLATGNAGTTEVSIAKELRPGAWSSAKVFLEGSPPSSIGYIQVTQLSGATIWLNKR